MTKFVEVTEAYSGEQRLLNIRRILMVSPTNTGSEVRMNDETSIRTLTPYTSWDVIVEVIEE